MAGERQQVAGAVMRTEICEQPARVRQALAAVLEQAEPLAAMVAAADHVVLLGRGSSRSAATYAAQAFRMIAGKPAFLMSPAELAWSATPPDVRRSLVVAISQSGESRELIAATARVRDADGSFIVVTNTPDSALTHGVQPSQVVHMSAGSELAVPATKSFTGALACLLGIAASARPGLLVEAVTGLPQAMQAVLDDAEARFRVDDADHVVCAGEGYAASVAEEAAIKLRETLQLPVSVFETSELLHGSINSISPGTTVITAAAADFGRHLAEQAADAARTRGARSVHIGTGAVSWASEHVSIPDAPDSWFPFLSIIPIQFATHDAALAAGRDPDSPPGLSKITRISDHEGR